MNERDETKLRRRAIRLLGQGYRPCEVQRRVQRSRGWLNKWQQRYAQDGAKGLRSQSRRPQHSPSALCKGLRGLIIQTRQRLVHGPVGLIGAASIQHELRAVLPARALPSLSSIYRVLHRQGLLPSTQPTCKAYYPWPDRVLPARTSLDALDWTCRFLEGGTKVYAFHSLNLRTRALHQTLSRDKSLATAQGHVLTAWKTQGIPDFLQLDNDAVFCGGYKGKRVLGQFVRLCLCVGVQPIFIPFKEPQRNGPVEQVNGLWGGNAFWKRHHFRCFGDVLRRAPLFTTWYQQHCLPRLRPDLQHDARVPGTHVNGHCPVHRPLLTRRLQHHIPEALPITAGRIHFIRRVQPDGCIVILNERWRVSSHLAGRYVWATITTHTHCLDIWYQRSPNAAWSLLKHADYDLGEPVRRKARPFTHLFTMS